MNFTFQPIVFRRRLSPPLQGYCKMSKPITDKMNLHPPYALTGKVCYFIYENGRFIEHGVGVYVPIDKEKDKEN